MKPNILVADSIAETGLEMLKKEGFKVKVKTGLNEQELIKEAADCHGIIVRSGAKITEKIIKSAKKLQIIARAGVGVDNIDVATATASGVVVVNSPQGNTLAAAEHTISLMMSMMRNIPAAERSLRAGKWDRKSFVGNEVFNKTLGVIGLGKIGSTVAKCAMGLGMKVIAHDPFASEQLAERIGVRLATLQTVLKTADIITMHLPKTAGTYHLISTKEFKMMKAGVRIVNCSRGGIIDEDALIAAIKSGKVAQAALDVFEKEPPTDSPLLDMQNVVITPHLGASTAEAQINVAIDVVRQMIDYFNGIPPTSAVNMPSVKPEIMLSHKPVFELGEKLGLLQAMLLDGNVKSIHITYAGKSAQRETALITRYILVGLLKPTFHEGVNFVNAPTLTQNRGITLKETLVEKPEKFSDLITLEVVTNLRKRVVAGTVFDTNEKRIVMIDDYWIDMIPDRTMLFVSHKDQPGIIGRVGTLLGNHNINIAGMQVGRESARGKAVMVLGVDDEINEAIMKELRGIEGVSSCRLLRF